MKVKEQIEQLQEEAFEEIRKALFKRDNTRVAFMTGMANAFEKCLQVLEREGEGNEQNV